MFSKIINLFLYTLSIFCITSYLATLYQVTDSNAFRNVSAISDTDLESVAEQLFMKSSGLYKYISVNYQGQVTSKNYTDNAPKCLLNVSSEIYSTMTTKSLVKLFDNYELSTYQPENVTDEEDAEENVFINCLLLTDTMLHAMKFLANRGFFRDDLSVYKEIIKTIWFHPYSRHKGVNGSSGFEHVFLAERKPRKGIIGLHNWIFFSVEELSNRINYFGFSRNIEFASKAAIAQVYFTYNGKRKMSSMFIGTTPELEIAIYTLCFYARPNKNCRVSFAGIHFVIQTYKLRNGSKQLVGTAFPIIEKSMD